jgi:hypothetical protein
MVDTTKPWIAEPSEVLFPSELASPSLGCAIKKHMAAKGYKEYKLSRNFEKPKVGKLVIPIEFR